MSYPEVSSQPPGPEDRGQLESRPAPGTGRRHPVVQAGLGAAVLAGVVVAVVPAAAPGALGLGTTGMVPAVHVLAGGNTTCCGQS